MTTLQELKVKETRKKIAVMEAFANGAKLLCWNRSKDKSTAEIIQHPSWDWVHYNYEVADEKD